tara:strand:+ start:264 stop:797 length:534 start_codon:yes stop_codon:yes gene_type:complete
MNLNFSSKEPSPDLSNIKGKLDPDYEFSKAINLFISQRQKLGISLEELSIRTKISKNVLIAIENGWKKYLPEKTYLISMLKKLEVELNLEIDSLNGLLEKKINIASLSKINFNFINIDFLSSWIGSLLYFIFMLISILALNSQQKYLLKIHSLTTEPVIMDERNFGNKNTIDRNEKK